MKKLVDILFIFMLVYFVESDVICPGGEYVCPNNWTCCPVGLQYMCCPYNHAVCCTDFTCVP